MMKKDLLFFFLFVFLSLFIFFADSKGFLRPFRRVGESATLPIQKKFFDFRIKVSSVNAPAKISEQKIEQLEREILSLKSEMVVLKEENQAIRRLLDAPLPGSWQFLPAKVIGEVAGVLKIDKDRRDEVEKMPIAVIDGVFVGKLIKVGEGFSLIQTPRSSGFKIQVISRHPEKEGILARGILVSTGKEIFLDRVLQDEEINEGDLVFTEGEGLVANIPVGKITKVITEKGEIYQKAVVEIFLKNFLLPTIFLVKPK